MVRSVRFDLRLADKADWVKVFDPRDSTVFVATDAPPEIGRVVRIDLAVGEAGPRVILRGKVISRRLQRGGPVPPGFSVALGPEEREKINYLNGFIRGGLLNLRSRRRLPLRLPVTWGGLDGPKQTHTRDINEEGVFVVTEAPLAEDSEVHLLITLPHRDEPLSISGVVSHTVVVEDEDVPGMGIVFRLDTRTRALMEQAIDELEERFLTSALPDAVLM
jgi:Tfp pilus assembly protein PilZ